MCGRFTSTAEAAALAERFAARLPDDYRVRFNVAPAQRVVAIRVEEDGERLAELLRWGLVPHWAKDPNVGYKMINARAETVREKPAYRSLLKAHRCLIPADGFYEWRVGPDGKKQPVRFTLADDEPFAFAGLWARWVQKETGEVLDSCTIVTTTANELVAPVHDRMPVILPRGAEAPWLDPALDPAEAVSLLVPYPADAMRARPASTLVNSASNDDPAILLPDDEQIALLG